MKQLSHTNTNTNTVRHSRNVNQNKNQSMNKSAILIDKWQLDLAQELPRYVAGRKKSKMRTININKGLVSQGIKNKTIYKILQASIKEAIRVQDQARYRNRQQTKNRALNNTDANNTNINTYDGSISQIEPQNNKKLSTKCLKPYPRSIVNVLYRQNIKNYNAYVVALDQLETITLSDDQKDRIRKLCYIGIARNYLHNKKYFTLPQYSRVGVLIRTYMVDVMKGHLQQKIQSQPYTTYININQTALSFNPYDRPKQIQEHISKRRYAQIIHGANKIIQSQYQTYKKGNFQAIASNFTYTEIILYLLVTLIIIVVMICSPEEQAQWLFYLAFVGVLVTTASGMIFAWMECNKVIGSICQPRNVTGRIQDRLREYFKGVGNQVLTWKVGADFYWIQIQNLKIKKRKMQDVHDNF